MAFDIDTDNISKDSANGSTEKIFGVPQFHAMDRKWHPAQPKFTEITAEILAIE